MIPTLVVIILGLVGQAASEITSVNFMQIMRNSTTVGFVPIEFTSFSFASANFVGCANLWQSSNNCGYTKLANFSMAFRALGINHSPTMRARAHRAFTSMTANVYLVIDPDRIRTTTTWTVLNAVYNATASETLIDTTYADTTATSFVLSLMANAGSPYYSLWHRTSGVTVTLPVAGSLGFNRMVYLAGQLYLSFQTQILIYNFSNLTFTLAYQGTQPSAAVNNMDISVNNGMLCYVAHNTLTLLAADHTTLYSLTIAQPFIGVKLLPPFIYATTLAAIYQIDFEAQQVISIVPIAPSNTQEFVIDFYEPTQSLFLYKQEPNINRDFYTATFNTQYPCPDGCPGQCYNTYGFNGTYCIKGAPNTAPYAAPPAPNITNNTSNNTNNTTDNSTLNTTDNSSNNTADNSSVNTTNNTSNNTIDNSSNNITISDPSWSNEPESTPATPETKIKQNQTTWLEWVSYSLSFSSMRIAPDFLLSFTGMLDDLWLYKYHRYEYPNSAVVFMQEVSLINEIRLDPWFLQTWEAINSDFICVEENQARKEYLGFSGRDPDKVYLLHSAQDTYLNNLLMNVIFLAALKLCHICVWGLFQKINTVKWFRGGLLVLCMRKANSTLEINSKLFLLCVSVLEVSMLKLTFDCVLQLLMVSNLNFLDRFNNMVNYLFMYALIMYCICFYCLTYSFCSRKQSEIVLAKCKQNLGGFCYEGFAFVGRNFIRALVHGLFLRDHPTQMIILAGLDAFFCGLAARMWSVYEYKVVAGLSIAYYFVMFLFDFFFALKQNTDIAAVEGFNSDKYCEVIMVMMVSISLAIALTLLVILVLEVGQAVFVHCSHKNKVESKDETSKIDEQIATADSIPKIVRAPGVHKRCFYIVKISNKLKYIDAINAGQVRARKFRTQTKIISKRISISQKLIPNDSQVTDVPADAPDGK